MADFEKVYSLKFDTKQAQARLEKVDKTLDKIEKGAKDAGNKINSAIGQKGSAAAAKFGHSVDITRLKLDRMRKSLNMIGGGLKRFGSWMSTRVTLPVIAAGAAAIKLASDYNESVNKVQVAFKEASGEVQNFARTTLKAYGIAEGTALDMSALFGDMATSMGLNVQESAKMSTELTGLAGDLASFKNMRIDEVQTALAGIFTGETESLKRLGVVQTQENLALFARNEGIKKSIKNMSQAEKVMLRYRYVMSVTKNAHGDFARTSDGAANQTRMFTEGLKQLGQRMGETVLPQFVKLMKHLNKLLDRYQALSEPQKEMVWKLGLIAAAVGPVSLVLGNLATVISTIVVPVIMKLLIPAFVKLFTVIVTHPVGALITGIGLAVVAAVALIYSNLEILRSSFEWVFASIVEYVLRGAKGIADGLNWITDKLNIDWKIDTSGLDAMVKDAVAVKGTIDFDESAAKDKARRAGFFGGDKAAKEAYEAAKPKKQRAWSKEDLAAAEHTASLRGGKDYAARMIDDMAKERGQMNVTSTAQYNIDASGMTPAQAQKMIERAQKKHERRLVDGIKGGVRREAAGAI